MRKQKDKKLHSPACAAAADDAKKRINDILDEILRAAVREPQLDSFYAQRAAAIKEIDDNGFNHISRRFLKAAPHEKEILVQFLKFWSGIEHLQFLQEFIARETFWPRIGTMILDIFNKCDAMVPAGLASSLLELDSLCERLKQHIYNRDALHDEAVERTLSDFAAAADREKEGIIIQLLDEAGTGIVPLLVHLLEKDAAWAQKAAVFIGSLSTPAALEILKQLYEKNRQKDYLKVIKKCIHALRQKGIDVADYDPRQPEEAVFKKITLPETRSFISFLDGAGDRIIFMIKPITTYESRVFEIFLNDRQGINEISSVTAFRKEAEQFIAKITSDDKIIFLETTAENACFLIQEAYAINERTGAVVSGSFAQWRSVFADALTLQKQPVIYQYLDAQKLQHQLSLLQKAEKLVSHIELIVWFTESDEAKQGWNKYKLAKNSPLVLNNQQVDERLLECCRETIAAFFDDTRRILFKRRLEELAYLFYKQGAEEEARIALCAALSLTSTELPPERNPFCLWLITEGFSYFESDTIVRDNKSRLIIDPHDVSLLA
jgi:hypothetical protein